MSKQLHILKEESDYITFRIRRGTSNIDITVISNQLLNTVVEWEKSEQESCSDHSTIRYAIGQSADHRKAIDEQELRYRVKKNNKEKFQRNLIRLAETLFEINKKGQNNWKKHFVHE